MDIAHAEKVEKELDNLITRGSKRKDPEEESEAWQQSVRRYNVRRRAPSRSRRGSRTCSCGARPRRVVVPSRGTPSHYPRSGPTYNAETNHLRYTCLG